MSCSISASRIIGTPASLPVCARAGNPVKVSAAAVARTTAREAGFTGRTLLGGRAIIIAIETEVALLPRPGATYGRKARGSTQGWRTANPALAGTKAGECGISGAG